MVHTSSCTLAQTSTFITTLYAGQNKNELWIIDSGTSDHMTNSPRSFISYSPCPSNYKVKIANGSLSTVVEKGSIKISKNLTFHSILHVPKLSCKLFSISKNVLLHSLHLTMNSGTTFGGGRLAMVENMRVILL